MSNEQIVKLLQKLKCAIYNSSENLRVCTPLGDHSSDEIIYYIDSEKLYSEINEITEQYQTTKELT